MALTAVNPSELEADDFSQSTRTSLLERLRDIEDQASWYEFFNKYARLIRGVALKAGLTDYEAEEVLQETIISVAKHLTDFNYDSNVCSFKTWMLRLTRWRILNQIRKRGPGRPLPMSSDAAIAELDSLAASLLPELTKLWDSEWQQAVLSVALQKIKQRVNPDHFQIFDLYVLRGLPVNEVTSILGISTARVYLAKHRVAALLRQEIAALDAAGW